MAFIDEILEKPSYGWTDEKGNFYKPSPKELIREFFKRTNVFKNKKNWLAFTSWVSILILFPFFILFIFKFFTWKLLIATFIYSMIIMGTHGTIWYHRYCTHGAYTFRNRFWRILTQNFVLKIIPEEIYVVSHHVHHAKSDTPGDPYNAYGGFLYCFLADVNHQLINRNLTEAEYAKASGLMERVGIYRNSYKQYQKWGSIANPFNTAFFIILNWTFWFTIFYLIGGIPLAVALFGGAFFWAVGVRTFNYEGHGKGKDKREDGMDFNRNDMSINQYWPGIVAGEWHNNHHLYPSSARAGFLKYQIDFAWYYIYTLYKIGGIKSYHDSKKQFDEQYYAPYIQKAVQVKQEVQETSKV
ncbi:MAG: fatty acid desaturase [Bacteroidota bacterium]